MAFQPELITKEDVLKAVKTIEDGKIKLHSSTGYDVIVNGQAYPPKDLLRFAHKEATGRYVWYHNGGEATNKYLRKFGFEIIEKNTSTKETQGYTWRNIYDDICNKLLEFEFNQPKLIEILKEAGITEGFNDIDTNGPNVLQEIDPFTFFSYINKTKNHEKRLALVKKVANIFNISAEISDFDGIPTTNAQNAWYFPYKKDRGSEDIPMLWQLFKEARNENINNATFQGCLQIHKVGKAKLTEGLFIVNPKGYLPLNGQTNPYLRFNGIDINFESAEDYTKILNEVSEKMNQPYYVVSYQAFLNNVKTPFWRIGTIDGKAKYWQEMYKEGVIKIGWPLLGDLRSITKLNRDFIYELLPQKGYDSKGNNSAVSKIAGQIWSFIKEIKKGDYVVAQEGNTILGIGRTEGDYYFEEGDDFPHKRKVEWLIVNADFPEQSEGFRTTVTEIKDQLTKNELLQFIEEYKETSSVTKPPTFMHPLNQILYGPPGTGKTYHTINHALAILENKSLEQINREEETSGRESIMERFEKYRERGLVKFITFHQNYSYDEFVQGLRPKLESSNQLLFERKDGVFKEISDLALKNLLESKSPEVPVDATFEEVFDSFFKDLIDETANAIKIPMESPGYSFDLTRYNPDLDNINFTKQSGGTNHNLFIPTLKRYFEKPEIQHTQGLRSYYIPLAKAMIEKAKEMRKIVKGVKRENFVLIIDEINRANISKVFGELITLLEKDKRWNNAHKLKITLPSGDEFTVPNNLYIIGTMNTADKSIALIDIALRRRFEFIGYYPDYNIPGLGTSQLNILKHLNKLIYAKKNSADYLIGHAYFLDTNSIEHILKNKVIPLIMEYFSGKTEVVKELFRESEWSVDYDEENYNWSIIPNNN